MNYMVYHNITGNITKTGTCSPSILSAQAGPNETAIENVGNWNDIDHKIVNGSVVECTQQEKDDKVPKPESYANKTKHLSNKDWDEVIARMDALEKEMKKGQP